VVAIGAPGSKDKNACRASVQPTRRAGR